MRGYYPGEGARAARNLTVFVLFVIGIFLMVGLYYVKTRAQSARLEVARLKQLVNEEIASVNVLKAEIAHLESPDRLERLAQKELALEPTRVDQIVVAEDIAALFSLRPAADTGLVIDTQKVQP